MENNSRINLDFQYEPTIFFRCHSKSDCYTTDYNTRIWHAVFEPESSNIVATAGGNRICLIDVEQCEVKHRYTAESTIEEFYSLTWNPRMLDGERSNVLIAGGKSNQLYFIYPRRVPENVLIGQHTMPKHNKQSSIYDLAIHPQHEDIVFCATKNNGIYVLQTSLSIKLDCKVEVLTRVPIEPELQRIVIGYDLIFAATENGLRFWNLKHVMKGSQLGAKSISVITNENPQDITQDETFVDSIELLGDSFIAIKYGERQAIYIFNLKHLTKRDEDNFTVVCSFILIWSITDEFHLEISSNYDLGILSCGDSDGSIWLYNLHNLKMPDSLEAPNVMKPANILNWPVVQDEIHDKAKKLSMKDILIHRVVISKNGNHIVAITDRNMVCLWRKCSVLDQ